MPITIVDVVGRDIRFPTSLFLDGSAATNPAPDYSVVYVDISVRGSAAPPTWQMDRLVP